MTTPQKKNWERKCTLRIIFYLWRFFELRKKKTFALCSTENTGTGIIFFFHLVVSTAGRAHQLTHTNILEK